MSDFRTCAGNHLRTAAGTYIRADTVEKLFLAGRPENFRTTAEHLENLAGGTVGVLISQCMTL